MLEILILHMFSNNCIWVDPQIVVWRTLIDNLVNWMKDTTLGVSAIYLFSRIAKTGTLLVVQGAGAESFNIMRVLELTKKDRQPQDTRNRLKQVLIMRGVTVSALHL